MKRWKLTYSNGTSLLLYSDTQEKYLDDPDVIDVKPYTDMKYMDYVTGIKEKCKLIHIQQIKTNEIREYYQCNYNKGILTIRLSKDLRDDVYFDLAEYQEHNISNLIKPVTYTLSTPKKVSDMINTPNIKYIIYSHRYYGEAKLTKPKELKGIKPIGSATYIPKKFNPQIFIKDNDIYIKHTDFFSPTWNPPKNEKQNQSQDYYMNKYFNANRKSKFIYSDNWAAIVLRCEAWLKLQDSIQIIKSSTNCLDFVEIVIQQQKYDKKFILDEEGFIMEWKRFWEDVYKVVKEYLDKENNIIDNV